MQLPYAHAAALTGESRVDLLTAENRASFHDLLSIAQVEYSVDFLFEDVVAISTPEVGWQVHTQETPEPLASSWIF